MLDAVYAAVTASVDSLDLAADEVVVEKLALFHVGGGTGDEKRAPTSRCASFARFEALEAHSRRPLCGRTDATRTSRGAPSISQRSAAPSTNAVRPGRIGSHFTSPRRPNRPAIRPTGDVIRRLGVAFIPTGGFFGIEDVHLHAAFGGRAHERAQCLSDAPAAADDLTEILGIDDQLDDRLAALRQ